MRGSISVFLAYLLALLMAVVFALLEVSRVWGLEQQTCIDVTMSESSILAGYSKELWQEYGLLLLDGDDQEGNLDLSGLEQTCLAYSAENLDVHAGVSGQITGQTWNLFGLKPTEVDFTTYGLVTDQAGRALIKEAVTCMEQKVGGEVVEALYELVAWDNQDSAPQIEITETDKEIVLSENPMDVVEQMKKSSILQLVTQEAEVSNKTIDPTHLVSNRSLHQGNYHVVETSPLLLGDIRAFRAKDALLFRLYLEEYFPCFVNTRGNHCLDYEMEYLVVGKSSDRENLQGVVNQLLGMREVANLTFLKTNAAKQEIVLAAATAMATATLSPELIPVYKAGIMAAWAYAEAVSDVRLLLDGQRVSMVKTQEQWHTDLNGLSQAQDGVKQSVGLDYQDYLQVLLWSKTDETLAYRAMDLMEKNTGYNMNHQIYYLDGTMSYQGKALFPTLITIGNYGWKEYRFRQPFQASYIGCGAVFLYRG